MVLQIDNFIGAQKARQALEDTDRFDVFELYLNGYITEYEKEKLDSILEKVQNRLISGLKEFEKRELTKK